MKKLLIALIILTMLMTATSCVRGNPSIQEQIMDEYILKYYGAYEIVDKTIGTLDMATLYTLKDTSHGFEYTCMVHEVPWADMGFGDNNEGHTMLISTSFEDDYMKYLLENKVDKAALQRILDANKDIELTIENTENYSLQSSENYPKIAIVCTKPREEPVTEIGKLFTEADSRNQLANSQLSMYTVTNGVLASEPLFSYNFFVQHTCSKYEQYGVAMLSEYLLYSNCDAKISINTIKTEYSVSNIQLQHNWTWAIPNTTSGTYITFNMDDKQYEFFTELCIQPVGDETDGLYGIVKGSYLDIIANERSGNRPLIIAMYASQFPTSYISLGIHLKELNQEENPEEAQGG